MKSAVRAARRTKVRRWLFMGPDKVRGAKVPVRNMGIGRAGLKSPGPDLLSPGRSGEGEDKRRGRLRLCHFPARCPRTRRAAYPPMSACPVHHHALDVDELADAEAGALAPVAGMLHPA